ncbi:hypothetical protein GIB67_007439 [Kingdonia uniflora]|uniref:Uncharacterized protein n=1 Tax=Kingdonia uniflora TaxID=39325 RepID=A0A7J7MM82_9MAGN|nr:hypothetical protein GIB67_007439 [Kingdonia uniflora]
MLVELSRREKGVGIKPDPEIDTFMKGVGTIYEMLAELSRREKGARIKPDPEIDALLKATALVGQGTSLVTNYILKILGLDISTDIMVGDDMRRGISSGQKKNVSQLVRVTLISYHKILCVLR